MKTLPKVATEMALARARLQPHAAVMNIVGIKPFPGGDPGLRSVS